MKPAFSPNLTKAILISELTFSPCSVILHFVGFGSNVGSEGVVDPGPPSAPALQPAPSCTALRTLQTAVMIIGPSGTDCAGSTTAAVSRAARAIAAAYSNVAAPASRRRGWGG